MKISTVIFLLVPVACLPWSSAGVEAADIQPSITINDPISIQRALDWAVKTAAPRLTIPPGEYEVMPSQPAGKRKFHLRVNGARNLEIDATGVTLNFLDPVQQSIGFFSCSNVTFRGATLRRKTSAVSQGTIAAIRDNGRSIDVRIDQGYPTDIDNPLTFDTFWTNVFSMDRSHWLAHYRAASPPPLKRLRPDLWNVTMNEGIADIGVPLQIGQPIGWRGEVYDDLRISGCEDMKFFDITVAGGSGMCFHEIGGGGGNLYKRCTLTFGAKPPGAVKQPLLSSSADGFHSNDTRKGPDIEDCLFEGCDDDAIAIHGFYSCVIEARADTMVVQLAEGTVNGRYADPGDHLRYCDENGVSQGESIVRSSRVLEHYQPPADFILNKQYRNFQNANRQNYAELILDWTVPAQANWLCSNSNTTGSGYIIRNTTIRNGFARGIMAKGSNGLIEGCTIERMARAAIEFMPEQLLWPESDYVQNIVVRNNTIRDVSFNREDGFLRHPGAIAIYAYRNGKDYIAGGTGHSNILVENNLFERNNGPNLLIATATGVTVRGNRFDHPMQDPSLFGTTKSVDPTALIWVTHARDVTIERNVVIDPGLGLKKEVGVGALVDHLLGADNGVKIDRSQPR